MSKLKTGVLFLAVVSSAALFFGVKDSYAVAGPCYFNTLSGPVVGTTNCGESGYGDYVTNDIFTGRNADGTGLAIGSGVNNKTDFINYIVGRFGGGTQNRIGAAFTMQSMRGSRAWPGNAQRDDWVMRMNLPGVTFWRGWDSSVTDTSYYDNDKKNVFYGDHPAVGREVIRIHSSGSLVAEIETACGNMVLHDYTDLPTPPEWTISGATGISGHEGGSTNANRWITPGETATWTHNATNNGPDPTDEVVNFRIQQSNNGGSSYSTLSGASNDFDKASNWNNGAANRINDRVRTWTAGQNQDGTTVCQRIRYQDAAWNQDGTAGFSGERCVTVYNRWRVRVLSTAAYNDSDGNGYPSVGETITWNHYAENTGEDNTSRAVPWSIVLTGSSAGAPDTRGAATGNFATGWGNSDGNLNTHNADTRTQTRTHTITSTDGGKTLCQTLNITNYATHMTPLNAASGTTNGGQRCITVPYDYELEPRIREVQPSGVSEVGVRLNVSPDIRNDGPTQSEPVHWEVHRLVYDPGQNPSLSGGNSASNPCAFYPATSPSFPSSCSLFPGARGSGTRQFPTGLSDTTSPGPAQLIPPLDPGARVCYVLSIQPWRNRPSVPGGNDWRHSDMVCVIVSKKPKIHVRDGDLKVRGTIDVSTSTIDTTPSATYGGWVDYGVFSTGANGSSAASGGNRISSGGGLRNGYGGAAAQPAVWSQLTFRNTASPAGNFTPMPYNSLHDYFMNQPATPGASLPLSSVTASGTTIINAGANPTIGASTIPVGRSIIVKATGTVTITGPITYDTTGTINGMEDIPQLVIVANDINIRASVGRVDAWLLAENSIDTCSDKPSASLTAADCPLSLTVNGHVSTSNLELYRTAGASKNNPEDPAEVFRLDPASYLWLYDFANSADRVKTTYVTEKPPRF